MPNNQTYPIEIFRRDKYLISTETAKINADTVHNFLANESYWALGISKQTVKRSINHSLCFGVYDCSESEEVQIGFARVITDYANFAYLSDVFILSSYRGQGLGKWLISCILSHNELQGLIKWMLNTKDAQRFYESYGFRLNIETNTYMVYQQREWTTTSPE